MKKRLSLLVLACATALSCRLALAGPVVSLEAYGDRPFGQTSPANLMVSGLLDLLGGFSLDISYDPTLLRFEVFEAGYRLGDVGAPVPGAIAVADDSTPGLIRLSMVSLLSDTELALLQINPMSGMPLNPLTLGDLYFLGIGEGISPLTIDNARLSTSAGDEFSGVATQGGSFNVPEPPAVFSFLIVALAAAAARASRRPAPRSQARPVDGRAVQVHASSA